MHRIKEDLRRLILAKSLTATTDFETLIEERHKDANLKLFNSSKNSAKDKPTRQTSPGGTRPSQNLQDTPHPSMTDDESGLNSKDSIMRITTGQRAFVTASSSVNFTSVELRLYRKVKASRPSELAVISYGSIFLSPDCTTAYDCFNSVCQQISTNCSFMIFQLPEDMSLKGSMRLQRGSGDAQTIFQVLLDIFGKAKKFPGEPQYRSVEVEVGFDILSED
jgi:hypothetical protein